MIVLETQYKQRAFDGYWQKWVKTFDYDNKYTFNNENGNTVSYIPEKWVVTAVYPLMMEIVD